MFESLRLLKVRNSSYVYLHNRFLRQYRRSCLYLVWAGVFSVIALVVFIPSYLNGGENVLGLGGTFNIASIVALMISSGLKLPPYGYLILLVLIDILLGGAFAALGYFAYQGKRRYLLFGLVGYSVDALVLSFSPLQGFYNFKPLDYFLSIIAHAVILFMLGLALYKRAALVELAASRKQELVLPAKDKSAKTTVLSYTAPKRKLENKDVFVTQLEEDETNKLNK